MEKYKITVTSASGVESAVKKELRTLGFPSSKSIDGGISVEGNAEDVARLNMFLGCADRVYISLTDFPAQTFDELFDGISRFPFGDIIPFNAKIIVNGKCRKSKLFAISSCQSIIKKAILSSLSKRYHRSTFPENGEAYRFEFIISADIVTLYLNTSGEGLHKRGWRDFVGEAPIKETLACAMLAYSDYSPEKPFCDPFCGSGTIIIEATRKALQIAPGKNRTFDYVKWDFFDRNAYSRVFEEALDSEKLDTKLNFSGFDLNPEAVALANRHAKRAGVADKLHIQVQNVKDFRSSKSDGCIVTNPPYGERLLNTREAYEVYSVLGNVYKTLNNWSLFAITSAPFFEKFFGKKCDKNRKLYNSGIECKLYQYFKNTLPGL